MTRLMLIRGEGCEIDEETGVNFVLMAAEDPSFELFWGFGNRVWGVKPLAPTSSNTHRCPSPRQREEPPTLGEAARHE